MSQICSVCLQEKSMRRALRLYGQPVCKKCANALVNRRAGAFLIDIGLLRIAQFGIGFALGVFAARQVTSGAFDIMILAAEIGFVVLFLAKDGLGGASIGKLICGVRVVDVATGMPIGIGTSLKRNLPMVIPFMPLIIAVTMKKGPRIGDGWAKSRVVWNRYADSPAFACGTAGAVPGDSYVSTTTGPIVDDGNPFRSPGA
jgi:uncharacterized RDD family membrane protein YckC